MRKLVAFLFVAASVTPFSAAPAYANGNCMRIYLSQLAACGQNTTCAGEAGANFILCEEAANRPNVPD